MGSDKDEGYWSAAAEWSLRSVGKGSWDEVKDENSEEWILMLGVAVICVRQCLRKEGKEALVEAGLRGIKVTVGFPEGDLYAINGRD